jgi:hypothetical protein
MMRIRIKVRNEKGILKTDRNVKKKRIKRMQDDKYKSNTKSITDLLASNLLPCSRVRIRIPLARWGSSCLQFISISIVIILAEFSSPQLSRGR